MEDLISRQAALDALNEYFARIGRLKRKGLTKGEKAISLDTVGTIKTLPSAEPKTGKWKYTKFFTWECSQCKKNPTKGLGYVQSKDELFDFCPNCGAKMKGADDE